MEHNPSHLNILGVRVDRATYDDAVARVRESIHAGGFHQIATVNPEFVVIAQTNTAFRNVLNSSSLNVADGIGLLWAARRLGCPLPERVTGQEMVERISALAAECGYRVFLLGAREGIAEQAAAALEKRHVGLVIAGCHAGSPDRREEGGILDRISKSRADILFVAYGPPRQELWISRNAQKLSVSVAMGVGGTFDTLAGIVPRAPQWMQRAGFEWTYRLIRQPRRIKRQTAIPYFMWLILTRKDPKVS